MSFMTTILLNTVTGKAQICVLYNVWSVRVTYGWLGVHYTIYCLKCGGSVGDNTQGYVVNLYVSSFCMATNTVNYLIWFQKFVNL